MADIAQVNDARRSMETTAHTESPESEGSRPERAGLMDDALFGADSTGRYWGRLDATPDSLELRPGAAMARELSLAGPSECAVPENHIRNLERHVRVRSGTLFLLRGYLRILEAIDNGEQP